MYTSRSDSAPVGRSAPTAGGRRAGRVRGELRGARAALPRPGVVRRGEATQYHA